MRLSRDENGDRINALVRSGAVDDVTTTSEPRLAQHQHAHIEDRSEVRFRVESIDIGIRLTLLMCAAGILYALYTWDERGGRQLIISLLGISAAVAICTRTYPVSLRPRCPRKSSPRGCSTGRWWS